MEKFSDKQFDNFIKDSLKSMETPYNENDWSLMEKMLDEKEDRKAAAFFFNKQHLKAAAIAAALLLTIGVGYYQFNSYSFTDNHKDVRITQKNSNSLNNNNNKQAATTAPDNINNNLQLLEENEPNLLSATNSVSSNTNVSSNNAQVNTALKTSENHSPIQSANTKEAENTTIATNILNHSNDKLLFANSSHINDGLIPTNANTDYFNENDGFTIVSSSNNPLNSTLNTQTSNHIATNTFGTDYKNPLPAAGQLLTLVKLNTINAAVPVDLLVAGVEIPESRSVVTAAADVSIPKSSKWILGAHANTGNNWFTNTAATDRGRFVGSGINIGRKISKHFVLQAGLTAQYADFMLAESAKNTNALSAMQEDINIAFLSSAASPFQQTIFDVQSEQLETSIALQYHLLPDRKLSPFVGVGWNTILPMRQMVTYKTDSYARLEHHNRDAARVENTTATPIEPVEPTFENVPQVYTPPVPTPNADDNMLPNHQLIEQTHTYLSEVNANFNHQRLNQQPSPILDLVQLNAGLSFNINKQWSLMASASYATTLGRYNPLTFAENNSNTNAATALEALNAPSSKITTDSYRFQRVGLQFGLGWHF